MLINSGDVVLVADSQGVRDVYDATNTALEFKLPLAVLVNRGTASASEVRPCWLDRVSSDHYAGCKHFPDCNKCGRCRYLQAPSRTTSEAPLLGRRRMARDSYRPLWSCLTAPEWPSRWQSTRLP